MVAVMPIRTDADYATAMARIEALWGAPSGTPQADELEVFMVLVAAFEQEHEPIELPDPIEAIRVRMADLSLTEKDVARALQITRKGLTHILERRRRINLPLLAPLTSLLGLSADCLVQPYELASKSPEISVEHTRKMARSLRWRPQTAASMRKQAA